MARQTTTYIIILLIGLAGGIVIGFLMTQQKIASANATIEQLKTEQSQSEDQFKTASTRLSRMEAELTRSRNDVMRQKKELQNAQTRLMGMKKVLEQTLGKGQGATTSQTPTRNTTTSITAARTILPTGTKEYTIKDGDSLWKIAANELGNGIRYKEILNLNPGMDENSKLTVGTTIKIPAK